VHQIWNEKASGREIWGFFCFLGLMGVG